MSVQAMNTLYAAVVGVRPRKPDWDDARLLFSRSGKLKLRQVLNNPKYLSNRLYDEYTMAASWLNLINMLERVHAKWAVTRRITNKQASALSGAVRKYVLQAAKILREARDPQTYYYLKRRIAHLVVQTLHIILIALDMRIPALRTLVGQPIMDLLQFVPTIPVQFADEELEEFPDLPQPSPVFVEPEPSSFIEEQDAPLHLPTPEPSSFPAEQGQFLDIPLTDFPNLQLPGLTYEDPFAEFEEPNNTEFMPYPQETPQFSLPVNRQIYPMQTHKNLLNII